MSTTNQLAAYDGIMPKLSKRYHEILQVIEEDGPQTYKTLPSRLMTRFPGREPTSVTTGSVARLSEMAKAGLLLEIGSQDGATVYGLSESPHYTRVKRASWKKRALKAENNVKALVKCIHTVWKIPGVAEALIPFIKAQS